MSKNKRTAAVLGVLTMACGLFPWAYTSWLKQTTSLLQTKESLRSQDVIRGAFANSGSKDVGCAPGRLLHGTDRRRSFSPDPDWDFKNRTWRGIPVTSKHASDPGASSSSS